jgi:dTDP-4-dehydrorhamnose reductase
MIVLVLGASGMIGSTMARVLAQNSSFLVHGVGRRSSSELMLGSSVSYHQCDDLNNEMVLNYLLSDIKPNIIINCVGLTKHYKDGNEPIPAISINSLFPHLLSQYSRTVDAKLIHVSSDCVFDGVTGNYSDFSTPNARDIYGKSKALGEVVNSFDITLRTSTIGHEFDSKLGLLEWFLSQKKCVGFTNAIFSGLSTLEFAKIVRDYVIPNSSLIWESRKINRQRNNFFLGTCV